MQLYENVFLTKFNIVLSHQDLDTLIKVRNQYLLFDYCYDLFLIDFFSYKLNN